jgi:hypothetical protein
MPDDEAAGAEELRFIEIYRQLSDHDKGEVRRRVAEMVEKIRSRGNAPARPTNDSTS